GIAALGDGLVGVPWSDLVGTSLDSRWRARMFGLTSAITGVLMLAIAPVIALVLGENGPGFPYNYAILFGIAGIMFAVSILPVIFVKELPGGKAVDKLPPITEFLPDLGRVLKHDLPYRAMIIIRLLTALFLMAAPFYIGFATEKLGLTSDVAVPNLLAMQTAGGILGAMLYTWLGARSNARYLRMALLASAMLPASALLADSLGPFPLYFGFFMSGIGTTNLMFGYMNWIVGYANDDERPMYVGLNNTIFAIVSMITPIIAGTVAEQSGYEALFAIALVMTLAALAMMMRYIHDPKEELPVVVAVGD
ncbi:MAG: MFS transporter, partial [Anaerolineae bacterium]|nr:MFS transporter [Anaerolineae bacterium]